MPLRGPSPVMLKDSRAPHTVVCGTGLVHFRAFVRGVMHANWDSPLPFPLAGRVQLTSS